jgi:protein SCO1/2
MQAVSHIPSLNSHLLEVMIRQEEACMKYRILPIVVIAVCILAASCKKEPERRFELKGTVVAVDKSQREATIAHEAVKGYMDAMTMPFIVKDDWALSILTPGQTVEAILVVTSDRAWIEGLRISEKKKEPGAVVIAGDPKIGEAVPDFSLLNQENKKIHLHQFIGRPLLITFIYTRCPLPNYCPLTSKNFSDIYRELKSMPSNETRPRLLTISFDTEYDSPAVLRSYAARYMNPVNFQAWEFATGSADEIRKITGYFGLGYWKESGQITHTLVTALIGPDGKLQRLYKGNDWKPQQVLAEFKHE